MDDSHHFVFLIEQVPVRFYRGFAEEPTVRTLPRQEAEAQQLGLALGIDEADGLVFRLALETGVARSAGGKRRPLASSISWRDKGLRPLPVAEGNELHKRVHAQIAADRRGEPKKLLGALFTI
jgi:hypothetical protein